MWLAQEPRSPASPHASPLSLHLGPHLNPAVLPPSPQTDYFHLFICVAIVAIYGDDVIEQQLATDQMLLHFGNLAMHMNGELVLRKVSACPPPRGPTCRLIGPRPGATTTGTPAGPTIRPRYQRLPRCCVD